MASTLTKIDIHLIFHVSSMSITVRPDDLPTLSRYIAGIIRYLDGIPIEIGGMPDHLHVLTSLPKTMSLSNFVRSIKANSSRWLRRADIRYAAFSWQRGYGAFSVSPSVLERTALYIRNQSRHHQKRSFREEYKAFLSAYGIEYDKLFAFSD